MSDEDTQQSTTQLGQQRESSRELLLATYFSAEMNNMNRNDRMSLPDWISLSSESANWLQTGSVSNQPSLHTWHLQRDVHRMQQDRSMFLHRIGTDQSRISHEIGGQQFAYSHDILPNEQYQHGIYRQPAGGQSPRSPGVVTPSTSPSNYSFTGKAKAKRKAACCPQSDTPPQQKRRSFYETSTEKKSPALLPLTHLVDDEKSLVLSLRKALCNPWAPPDSVRQLLQPSCWAFSEKTNTLRAALHTPDHHGCFPLDHAIQMVVQCSFYTEQKQSFYHEERLRDRLSGSIGSSSGNKLNNTLHSREEQMAELALERLAVVLQCMTALLQKSDVGFPQPPPYFGYNPGPRPLIRLLSISAASPTSEEHSDLILKCTRLLLEFYPCCLYQTATTTGCSCLHVALRRSGTHVELVKCILEHDKNMELTTKINHAGDTALHVACAQQVPFQTLQLVVETTVRAVLLQQTKEGNAFLPCSVVGQSNHAGYNALDLECIKFLEGGNNSNINNDGCPSSFFSLCRNNASNRHAGNQTNVVVAIRNRSLERHRRRNRLWGSRIEQQSPAGISGGWAFEIADNPSREKPMYERIWQRAVDRIKKEEKTRKNKNASEEENHIETHFIPRIVLLVNATAIINQRSFDTSQPLTEQLLCRKEILHRVCMLCAPHELQDHDHLSTKTKGTIPWFLLDYFSWKYHRQLVEPDVRSGKLPIHHVLTVLGGGAGSTSGMYGIGVASTREPREKQLSTAWCEWYLWVERVLKLFPDGIKKLDNSGQLPLHTLLNSFCSISISGDEISTGEANSLLPDVAPVRQRNLAMKRAAKLLIDLYPESLEQPDPVSGLFPCFEMARSGSLDETYEMFRAFPSVLSSHLRINA